jgi:hypothetical protein
MIRIALSEGSLQALHTDAQRRSLIRLSLHLVPFAGIAFLWFIGVVREQLGNVEDRLFSTVFLGSGLLFLAMLFIGAVTSTSLLGMLAGSDPNPDLFAYGRNTTQTLISVYAMRMAAVSPSQSAPSGCAPPGCRAGSPTSATWSRSPCS